MANTLKVKSANTISATKVVTPAVTTNSNVNNSGTLTIVVLDAKSQPVAGANVSITPSDASAVTNSAGEVQFKLGSATKYEVTASSGSNTVTVPYYVTANGATRLVVNPVYVKSVEAQLHQSSGFNHGFLTTAGVVIGIIIVVFVIWRLFRRK